jgi:hypothetical protein
MFFVWMRILTKNAASAAHGGTRMKVTYQQGLENLAGSLSQMGFEMIPLGQEQETDAVLYRQGIEAALRARPSGRGALLLNVRGLSAAQTAQALRRRCHAQIF